VIKKVKKEEEVRERTNPIVISWLKLKTGLGQDPFYSPRDVWFNPVVEWVMATV